MFPKKTLKLLTEKSYFYIYLSIDSHNMGFSSRNVSQFFCSRWTTVYIYAHTQRSNRVHRFSQILTDAANTNRTTYTIRNNK